jgi:hypothetical protein
LKYYKKYYNLTKTLIKKTLLTRLQMFLFTANKYILQAIVKTSFIIKIFYNFKQIKENRFDFLNIFMILTRL